MEENRYRPPTAPLTAEELGALALGKGPGRMTPWQLYVRLGGRISRRTFWVHGVLVLLLVGLAFNAALDITGLTTDNTDRLVNLLLIWPLLALSAKRAHDFDWSGWWVLLHFVPVIGSLAMIAVLGCVPGTRGPNRFGPEPLAPLGVRLNTAH